LNFIQKESLLWEALKIFSWISNIFYDEVVGFTIKTLIDQPLKKFVFEPELLRT